MKNKTVDFIITEAHQYWELNHFSGVCPFIDSVGECNSKCMQSRDECNLCIKEHNKEVLRKAFEVGRTVINHKGEWEETYSDN